MKDVVYLVVTEVGAKRMTKSPPSLRRNEIAIRMQLTVPDECFLPLIVDVDVEVPEEMIIPAVVEPEPEPVDPA